MIKRKILSFILLFIAIFTYILVLFYLNKLSIIPLFYCYVFSFIEFFIIMLCLLFNKFKNVIIDYISIFITIVIILINGFGIYYIQHIDHFLDSFTGDILRSDIYYVVTSKNNGASVLDDISSNSNVYYYGLGSNSKQAMEMVGTYQYNVLEEYNDFFVDGLDKDDYLLIEKNIYNLIFENFPDYDINNYKVIYEFNIASSLKRNEEVKDVYNILIIGKDFGGYNDFNLLVTVNTLSHEIILTSMVRDYHIPVVGYNFSENLSPLVLLGEDTVRKTIGSYFGVEVDYLFNFKAKNVVNLIDNIGGIEFCSKYSFYTKHAMVIDTYNDSLGKKLYIKSGCQHLNGIEALTVARDRSMHWGDNQRQINCRQIAEKIVDKIISNSNLLNYTSVLDSFDGLYETDMNRKAITTLVRSLISNDYKVYEYLANGHNTMGMRFQEKKPGYVTYPDKDTANVIREKIKEVMNNK